MNLYSPHEPPELTLSDLQLLQQPLLLHQAEDHSRHRVLRTGVPQRKQVAQRPVSKVLQLRGITSGSTAWITTRMIT